MVKFGPNALGSEGASKKREFQLPFCKAPLNYDAMNFNIPQFAQPSKE